MAKMASVAHTKWAFYDAMDAGDAESMSSWFETLLHHYKRRGELLRIKQDQKTEILRKWNEDVIRRENRLYVKMQNILHKYPRSDNFSIGGRLVSANYVMLQDVQAAFNKL